MAIVVGPRNLSVLTSGLIYYVDAGNDNSIKLGESTWKDLSQSNNGTLTNGAIWANNNNGAVSVDGVDDFVDVPGFSITSEIGSGSDFTIYCWFKADNNVQGMIVSCPGAPRFYIEQIFGGGYHRVHWGIGGAQNSSTSLAFLNITDIFNYVVTYDGTNARGYLNGVLTDTTNIGSQTYSTATLRLGKYTDAYPLYFNGNIYQAAIYNRALTGSEVLTNYNTFKTRFGY